ncbi:hypothetical protein D1872_189460 [compost metagenome]
MSVFATSVSSVSYSTTFQLSNNVALSYSTVNSQLRSRNCDCTWSSTFAVDVEAQTAFVAIAVSISRYALHFNITSCYFHFWSRSKTYAYWQFQDYFTATIFLNKSFFSSFSDCDIANLLIAQTDCQGRFGSSSQSNCLFHSCNFNSTAQTLATSNFNVQIARETWLRSYFNIFKFQTTSVSCAVRIIESQFQSTFIGISVRYFCVTQTISILHRS